jgi:hypothetical protein
MVYLSDKDKKKISLQIKKNIQKELKVKNKINTRKMFDIWSSIALEWELNFENINFVEMNKPWGFNYSKIRRYFYNKFIKDFRGGNNGKTFKKKLFDLLDEAKNKSIQDTKIERKFPFKQRIFPDEMNEGDWYSPPGTEVKYSTKKITNNPYQVEYYRKTKIPFFKGPQGQEDFILKNKWKNTYTYGFIYGYIKAWQNMVFINWKEVRRDDFKNLLSKVKLIKTPNVRLKTISDKGYYDFFFKKNYTNYLTNRLKLQKNIADDIFIELEKSIFDSNLSKFLFYKKENYFTFQERKFDSIWGSIRIKKDYHHPQMGIQEFTSGILSNRELFLGKTKDGRFYNTVLNSRIDSRKKNIYGPLYNYEQFLLYTMFLQFISPMEYSKLDINERDIFLRFAVNRGKDEFLTYAHAKII